MEHKCGGENKAPGPKSLSSTKSLRGFILVPNWCAQVRGTSDGHLSTKDFVSIRMNCEKSSRVRGVSELKARAVAR